MSYDNPASARGGGELNAGDPVEKRLASLIMRVGDKISANFADQLAQLASLIIKDHARHGETVDKTYVSWYYGLYYAAYLKSLAY